MSAATITGFGGYKGNFTTDLTVGDESRAVSVNHGVIIVATGAREIQTTEYLRDQAEAVITQRELEGRLAGGSLGIGTGGQGSGDPIESAAQKDRKSRTPNRIAMIQCVGSREDGRPYCSRVCCQTAVKNALKIKQIDPEARVTIFYRDVRTYGFSEDADYRIAEMQRRGLTTAFTVHRPGNAAPLSVELNMPGQHNVLNAKHHRHAQKHAKA